jgi:hypothetical protein
MRLPSSLRLAGLVPPRFLSYEGQPHAALLHARDLAALT